MSKKIKKEKRKSINRLSNYMLKRLLKQIIEQLSNQKKYLSDENLDSKSKLKLVSETRDAIAEALAIISEIMCEAENAKEFEFTEKDAANMSIRDIQNKMNIKSSKEDLKEKSEPKVKVVTCGIDDLPDEVKDAIKEALEGIE
jgi:hypothetical protein